MFNLSDRVRNRITADIGIVVGYGNYLTNNNYSPTIKVRIISPTTSTSATVEDIFNNWCFSPKEDSKYATTLIHC